MDTNVLIYLADQNEREKRQRAKEIVDRLLREKGIRIGAQSLAEFAHAALRKLKPPLTPEETNEWIEAIVQIGKVIDLTPPVVREALRGMRLHNFSYSDAQIWAVASLNQIPVVFSEDFQDGMEIEGVRFVNPFTPAFDLAEWV
jgi:predicted nucleic acid-binding protein